MNVAIEISMYPLNKAYETAILAFIQRLKAYPDITVRVNQLSTQLFGDYHALMTCLQEEIKPALSVAGEATAMVMKIVYVDNKNWQDEKSGSTS
jgi:uncharacterized protein YqgV (UPF0045/DUF77 family)